MSPRSLSTAEVLRELRDRTGQPIKERTLHAILRYHPELAPPVVSGRRLWDMSHVEGVLPRVLVALSRSRLVESADETTEPSAA